LLDCKLVAEAGFEQDSNLRPSGYEFGEEVLTPARSLYQCLKWTSQTQLKKCILWLSGQF